MTDTALLQIPGFKLKERLSQGTHTAVYRGLRDEDGAAVVLKVLDTSFPSLKHLARLKHEYELIASLDDAKLVRALDFRAAGNQVILVLEDVGGMELGRYIQERTPSLKERVSLCLEVTRQLKRIHCAEIVHKDVNPGNVIINPRTGKLYIIDFSISSRFSETTPKKLGAHTLAGTLAYISPEQTGRMNRGVDYRSDFYGLGISFYQILTDQLPFELGDPIELVHCHLARKPPPLYEFASHIPRVLGGITAKLTAKNPEDRYQSAEGIIADLEQCLRAMEAGEVPAFAIGQSDRHHVFRIPQKLFGRASELKIMMDSFDRVSRGGRELLLISGPPGVGKTALAREVYEPVSHRQGHLIHGKFDQYQHAVPYAPIMQAFGELVHQLLAHSEMQLSAFRRRIVEALGPGCAVLAGAVPDLSLIVGEQPPVEEVTAAETENRFYRVIRDFVMAVSRPEHPLVMVLDDLQWADSATLRVVEMLLEEKQIQGLMLVGAYRESDLTDTHPLHHALVRLRGGSVKVFHIFLNRLKLEHVSEVVGETMRTSVDQMVPLSKLVYRKTEGNPFFVNEFLRSLHQEGLIYYCDVQHAWRWDQAGVSRMGVTEDLLAFLASRLKKLPQSTRRTLTLAACLGNPFKVRELAMISGESHGEVASDLEPALKEGLVFADHDEYLESTHHLGAVSVPAGYTFLHDRVQQAAMQLIPGDERCKIHLQIARLMLQNASEDDLGEQLFDIAGHFNQGASWLEEDEERLRVARLNLLAGIRARLATAYEPALGFLTAGLALLPEDCWQRCHGLAMALYRERAECEYLCGNFETAEQLFSGALEHARTVMEKAVIYNLRCELYVHLGKYAEAIEIGLEALQMFGIEVPIMDNALEGVNLGMISEIDFELSELDFEQLLNLPPMEDEIIAAIMKLMANLWIPAANLNQNLMKFLSLYLVKLTLEHGNTELSAFGYAAYGMVLGSEFGEYQLGERFGELGMRLSLGYDNIRLRCRVLLVHAAFVMPWRSPLRETLPLLQESYRAGMECGDYMWATMALLHMIHHRVLIGDSVELVNRQISAHMGFISKVRYEQVLEITDLIRRGWSRLSKPMDDGLLMEKAKEFSLEFITRNQRRLFLVAVFHFYVLRAQLNYYFRNIDLADSQSDQAEKYVSFGFGWTTVAEHYYYRGLIAAARYWDADEDTQPVLLARINESRDRLEQWAQNCPANFEARYMLLTAEWAAIKGQFEEALDCYDGAVAAAREHELLATAALAAELAGRYLQRRGKNRIALVYLADACILFEQFGAKPLVERIRKEFPRIVQASSYLHGSVRVRSGATTTEDGGGFLDMSSLMKASLAISSEIHLDALLEKILRIVIENAGARKGVLFMEKDKRLFVEAESEVDAKTIHLSGSKPLAEAEGVPRSLIHYVFNTGKPLVLGDAARQGEFTADPYIALNQVKSVLCRPMVYKGKVNGILYLENNLTSSAFTPYHLEVLKLLTSEAAGAMENARLYANLANATTRLRDINAELERYNRDLEIMVDDRTRELKLKNRELESTLERNREMQKQIIQQEKMASLGTLTAGIAHEIRNPLNFVNNFAEVSAEIMLELEEDIRALEGKPLDAGAVDEVVETIDDIKDNLSKINQHGRRADRIVHTMLLHSHKQSSSKPKATDVNALVEEFVDLGYHAVRARDARFAVVVNYDFEEDLPEIEAVQQDLSRVILNIVDNACYAMREHSEREGASYVPQLIVTTRKGEGDGVEVRFHDNGGGINTAMVDKIFNPFFTTKPAGKGTGLGLSICYDIVVKQHQGSINVNSRDDETEFILTFPTTLYKPTKEPSTEADDAV